MHCARKFCDALTVAQPVLEKLRSMGLVQNIPIRHIIRDLRNRRCKQKLIIEAFAHRMDLALPPKINPISESPVADGYQYLFDEDDPQTDVLPDDFAVLEITAGGRRRLHAFWNKQGDCFASCDLGPWLTDGLHWATQHKDPRRLADLNLVRHLVGGLVRGGHVTNGFADLTTFCCDDSGFGAELKIQLFSPERDPAWPYVNPEDGEPDFRTCSSLYVGLDRRTLFSAKWGEADSGLIVSMYSELGHFHEPLLRWAKSL
jgi:hypothetical protein